MSNPQWRLQDAKARFSEVVEAAMQGEPQHVTRRGRDAVVVLSAESFRTLQKNARVAAPTFIAHLLAIPKDAEEVDESGKIALRELEL